MKKTVRYMMAAAAMTALAVSCAKEEIVQPQTGDPVEMTFTAEALAGSVKTSLQPDGKVFWTEGDAISIFDGAGENRNFGISDINGSSAKFDGSAIPADTYYAVYPYSESAEMAGNVITATLSATQTALDGTFASEVNLSAAVSSDNSLTFKNLCGLLSVSVEALPEGYTLQSVSIKGQNGEMLAGAVKIQTPDMTASAAAEGGSASVTLTADAWTPGTYVFTALPAELTKGLVLTFDYAEGSASWKLNDPVTITAGHNTSLPGITEAPAPKGSADNPYTISTAEDLLAFAAAAGEYGSDELVVLDADIDMSGQAWTPFVLGCTLDGQDHRIYNMSTASSTTANFITQVTGTLKNVVFGSSDGMTYDGQSTIGSERRSGREQQRNHRQCDHLRKDRCDRAGGNSG